MEQYQYQIDFTAYVAKYGKGALEAQGSPTRPKLPLTGYNIFPFLKKLYCTTTA
jgi:hypothetical protein